MTKAILNLMATKAMALWNTVIMMITMNQGKLLLQPNKVFLQHISPKPVFDKYHFSNISYSVI